jgi:hypothetical protein
MVTLTRSERPLPRKSWTFITHHAHVLLSVAREPSITVHEIAAATGITER